MRSYPQIIDMRGAQVRGRFAAPPRIGQTMLPTEIAPAIQRNRYASALNGLGFFGQDPLPQNALPPLPHLPSFPFLDTALAPPQAQAPAQTAAQKAGGGFTSKEWAVINDATQALQDDDSALAKKLLGTLDATVIPKLHTQAVETGSAIWSGMEKLAREALLGEAPIQGGTTIEQKTLVKPTPGMKTGTKLAIVGGVGVLGLGALFLFLRRRR